MRRLGENQYDILEQVVLAGGMIKATKIKEIISGFDRLNKKTMTEEGLYADVRHIHQGISETNASLVKKGYIHVMTKMGSSNRADYLYLTERGLRSDEFFLEWFHHEEELFGDEVRMPDRIVTYHPNFREDRTFIKGEEDEST